MDWARYKIEHTSDLFRKRGENKDENSRLTDGLKMLMRQNDFSFFSEKYPCCILESN